MVTTDQKIVERIARCSWFGYYQRRGRDYCSTCGEKIHKGERVIRHFSGNKTKVGRLYHIACFQKKPNTIFVTWKIDEPPLPPELCNPVLAEPTLLFI